MPWAHWVCRDVVRRLFFYPASQKFIWTSTRQPPTLSVPISYSTGLLYFCILIGRRSSTPVLYTTGNWVPSGIGPLVVKLPGSSMPPGLPQEREQRLVLRLDEIRGRDQSFLPVFDSNSGPHHPPILSTSRRTEARVNAA